MAIYYFMKTLNPPLFKTPEEALMTVFNYNKFRDFQDKIIHTILEKKDCLSILTTGGGKSITYQIPAMCMNGMAVVVSPLIALMKDQVDRLSSLNIPAAYINSSLSMEDSLKVTSNILNNKYKMLYISPEKLQDKHFVDLLKNIEISFFAIDEAHCLSLWGRDFRLSYKHIIDVIKDLESHNGSSIPKYACTATATPAIKKDIVDLLEMNNQVEFIGSFERNNIDFSVKNSTNKTRDVIDICKQNDSAKIVYCTTIRTAVALANELKQADIKVGLYHGQLDNDLKVEIQNSFLNNELNVMVATNAFGMGIDKSNIKTVIHYQMPANLENYYQEAGRAGRDGNQSEAILLYSEKDRKTQDFFIDMTFPDVKLIKGVQYFFRAFNSGEPITLSIEEIANISPNEIKPYQIASILRILNDQGIINVFNNDSSYDSPVFEVIDAYKNLELDYLVERKKQVINSLNIMNRYCQTKRCLRDFILEYFNEEQKQKGCGKCSTCKTLMLSKGMTDGIIPKESIETVLELAKNMPKNISKNDFVEILLGIKSNIFHLREFDKLKQYGTLSHWTKSNTTSLVDYLLSKEFLCTYPRNTTNILITPKGKDFCANNNVLSAPKSLLAISSGTSKNAIKVHKTGTILDHVLYSNLIKLRENLSKIYEKPQHMILSDKIIKLIATVKPQNTNQLIDIGLTPMRAKVFSNAIINVVEQSFQEHKKENDEFTMTF